MLRVLALVVTVLLELESKEECVVESLDLNVMKVFHVVWKEISLMLQVPALVVTVLVQVEKKEECVEESLEFNVMKV
jgi:hypothetical protein